MRLASQDAIITSRGKGLEPASFCGGKELRSETLQHHNRKGGNSDMRTSPLSVAEADTQQKARRGLAIYLVAVGFVTSLFDVVLLLINPFWGFCRVVLP